MIYIFNTSELESYFDQHLFWHILFPGKLQMMGLRKWKLVPAAASLLTPEAVGSKTVMTPAISTMLTSQTVEHRLSSNFTRIIIILKLYSW